jgi:hypothetical protein
MLSRVKHPKDPLRSRVYRMPRYLIPSLENSAVEKKKRKRRRVHADANANAHADADANAGKKRKEKKKVGKLTTPNHTPLKTAEHHKQHRHRKSRRHLPAGSSAGLFRREAAGLSWLIAVFAAIVRWCRFLRLERTRER